MARVVFWAKIVYNDGIEECLPGSFENWTVEPGYRLDGTGIVLATRIMPTWTRKRGLPMRSPTELAGGGYRCAHRFVVSSLPR
jgi:hypothetical protein